LRRDLGAAQQQFVNQIRHAVSGAIPEFLVKIHTPRRREERGTEYCPLLKLSPHRDGARRLPLVSPPARPRAALRRAYRAECGG
jgi:hypothetical protein